VSAHPSGTRDPRALICGLDPLPISDDEARAAVRHSLRRDHPVDVTETVVGHVRRWAERTPQAVALADGGAVTTYRALADRVAALREFLVGEGCEPGMVLAAVGPRSTESVVVLLALESLGITYLPLDAGWPRERLSGILARSGASRLLDYHRDAVRTQAAVDAAAEAGVRVLPLPDPAGLAVPTAAADPDAWYGRQPDPAEPRYVLFTSGTTGTPKGALNDHRGLINHLRAMVEEFGLGPADVVGLTAALTFDIVIWQMLTPLLVGGTVAVLPEGDMGFPRTLVKRIEGLGITVLELVPTVLEWIVASSPRYTFPQLRCVLSTGEELTPQLAGRLMERLPGVTVVNAYGFTEASDDVSFHVVSKDDLAGGRLPLGLPTINTVLYVLIAENDGSADGTGEGGGWRAARPGESGELFVGGLPPGCGYVGDDRATRAAFFRDVLDEGSPTGRLYRSGDAAVVDDGGVLRYLGRLDRQVKVGGVRMELGEIEATLRHHPAVADCAVVAAATAGGEGRRELVAYCVPRDGAPLSHDDLRAFLREHLPAAMIPVRWRAMDVLLVTPNGKTDHRALTLLAEGDAPDLGIF
jgi:amino acid adenylation domain-containing protein